jgi:hypothetical protein
MGWPQQPFYIALSRSNSALICELLHVTLQPRSAKCNANARNDAPMLSTGAAQRDISRWDSAERCLDRRDRDCFSVSRSEEPIGGVSLERPASDRRTARGRIAGRRHDLDLLLDARSSFSGRSLRRLVRTGTGPAANNRRKIPATGMI